MRRMVETDAARVPMRSRFQTTCAVLGVVGLVLILGGMLGAHLLPPPRADWTADQFRSFYATSTGLKRFGIFLLLFGTAFFAPLVAGMTVVLERIEGPRPSFARLQGVIGAVGTTLLVLFSFFLAAAAFRPERSADVTTALHDLGWFMAFLSAVPFTLQAAVIATVVLAHPEGLLPRWFGYVNISVAVLLLPGVAVMLFKTGPLSYHGILGYWIPLFVFGIWMLAMAWAIRRSAARPEHTGP
jgi:hypothetical protein